MEARLWAELHGFTYFETSANNGLGVTDMFQGFFSQIVRLAEAGLTTKTPKQGKKPVGLFTSFDTIQQVQNSGLTKIKASSEGILKDTKNVS